MERPRWNTIQLTTKSHESCLSSLIRLVHNSLSHRFVSICVLFGSECIVFVYYRTIPIGFCLQLIDQFCLFQFESKLNVWISFKNSVYIFCSFSIENQNYFNFNFLSRLLILRKAFEYSATLMNQMAICWAYEMISISVIATMLKVYFWNLFEILFAEFLWYDENKLFCPCHNQTYRKLPIHLFGRIF